MFAEVVLMASLLSLSITAGCGRGTMELGRVRQGKLVLLCHGVPPLNRQAKVAQSLELRMTSDE
jgi:hypothetical protein